MMAPSELQAGIFTTNEAVNMNEVKSQELPLEPVELYARGRLEELVCLGNKNAREALEKKRRIEQMLSTMRHPPMNRAPYYSDLLMRVQLKELADLSRMGFTIPRQAIDMVRKFRGKDSDKKKLVDELYWKVLSALYDSMQYLSIAT